MQKRIKISLCIETILQGLSYEDRIRIAKDCGADAIELWDAGYREGTVIAATCKKINMPIACMSVMDSWNVRLNDAPSKVLSTMESSIKEGKDIGCSTFIGLAGDKTGHTNSQKSLLIANLSRIAELLEKHNCVILIEPLNSLYDHKGYSLDSAQEGFEIVRSVSSPCVKLLYDIYHMQLMEGNLINSINNYRDTIGHFHCAGVPGRHEPKLGEINYPAVIQAIEKTGYSGFYGLEYWPTYTDEQSIMDSIKCLRDAH